MLLDPFYNLVFHKGRRVAVEQERKGGYCIAGEISVGWCVPVLVFFIWPCCMWFMEYGLLVLVDAYGQW